MVGEPGTAIMVGPHCTKAVVFTALPNAVTRLVSSEFNGATRCFPGIFRRIVHFCSAQAV